MNKCKITLLFLLFTCIFISCNQLAENNILQEISSPDNCYKAIVFSRTAGATTAFNIQISIIEQNKKLPNKPGNIFISDYVDNLEVYWLTEKELQISVPISEIRIYKNEAEIKGIKIVYDF